MLPAVMLAAVSVVLRTCTVPSGAVTRLLTTSPTCEPAGNVMLRAVPPALSASAALTMLPSGMARVGAPGAVVSTMKLWVPLPVSP